MGDLEGFAISRERLAEETEEIRLHRSKRDARICVCGHPVARHSEYGGRTLCAPTRMTCPCSRMLPVIEVTDTRPFLRKTRGSGAHHALMQGLYGLIEKGREWKWLTGHPVCMRCSREGVAVLPFALGARGMPSVEPEGVNVLLCDDCATIAGRGEG